MGAEKVVGMGAWTSLGRVLDAQRPVARADRAVACPWLFRSGVEPTRSALLRFDRPVLDWSPVIEYLSRLLHGSVPTSPPRTAGPIHCAAATDNSRMFCAVSSARLRVAVDARGTIDWTGDNRLRVRDIPFRRATFRCAFTLSFTSGSGLMPSDETLGSLFRADCWRRACVCRGYFSWSSCVPGPMGRSLVPGVDCVR